MSDATLLDRIHALVEGTLSAQEAERLEREIAADPQAQVLLAEYREVHELTSLLADEAPASSLSLEDVVPRRRAVSAHGRVGWGGWRLAAAAAFLIGVTAFGGWQALSPSGPGEVELAAIPLGDLPQAPARRTVPASLESFAPATDDGVRWLDSLPEAREIAALVDRPILLFVEYPGCPYCEWMDAHTFGADAVRERFRDVVPVRLNIMTLGSLSPEQQPELLRTEFASWPLVGVIDADGSTVSEFAGKHGAAQFRELLDDALDGVDNSPVPWSQARELTTRFLEAESARAAGRMAEAWERYTKLRDEPHAAFAALGAWGRGELQRVAREYLDTARRATGETAAFEELDAGSRHLAGTPLGEELARVRDALSQHGAFPELEPPPGGSRSER